jgi:hypothetical protein
MKPTKISALISYAVATSIIGAFVAELLVRSGAPIPVSPTTLVAVLPFISVSLVTFAWPILKYRQAVRARLEQAKKDATSSTGSQAPKRVDPFYAVRVALLAKSTAITGSIFSGWHAGVLIALLGSPAPTAGLFWRAILAVAGSIAMVVCGLVVERACKVPPDAKLESGDADGAAA